MRHFKGIPEHLYHYTTVNTAKLIIKNRTIRFNSLANMDDKQEPKTKEFPNIGAGILASCWSEESESIPQWNMYASDGRGVCIRLHSFPFENLYMEYVDFFKRFQESMDINEDIDPYDAGENFIVPPHHVYNQDYVALSIFTGGYHDEDEWLRNRQNCQVTYTSEPEKLIPQCFSMVRGFKHINFSNLGVVKDEGWEFQKEWKYRIILYPLGQAPDAAVTDHDEAFRLFTEGFNPIDYIDLKIDLDFYNTMEIIAGPLISSEDYNDLSILMKEYIPYSTLVKSKYTGTIKLKEH